MRPGSDQWQRPRQREKQRTAAHLADQVADCQSMIIVFMWCWWSARNKINAGEKVKTAQQIVSDVLFHLQAWRDAVSTEKRVAIPVCKSKWQD